MRLDHLLSKEREEVKVVLLLSHQGDDKAFAELYEPGNQRFLGRDRSKADRSCEATSNDDAELYEPRNRRFLGRDRVAYTKKQIFLYESKLSTSIFVFCARTTCNADFLVSMRLRDTPVPIPNTMVKT